MLYERNEPRKKKKIIENGRYSKMEDREHQNVITKMNRGIPKKGTKNGQKKY